MNSDALQALKTWFTAYCGSFSTPLPDDQRNIAVKEEHTRQVCLNAARIAKGLGLDPRDVLLAEAIALFHDVGRFPQYQQYKTFNDSLSVNHAALGAKVLLDNNVLRDLGKREQEIIVRSVTLHNVFAIPERLDAEVLLHLKLVRDADKLDIWRVFMEYYHQRHDERRATAVALGLPDRPGYSREILACLRNRQLAKMSELKTLNDLKLLQLAWIYDLNFPASLNMARERDYVNRLAETLPKEPDIEKALEVVRAYLNESCRADGPENKRAG